MNLIVMLLSERKSGGQEKDLWLLQADPERRKRPFPEVSEEQGSL